MTTRGFAVMLKTEGLSRMAKSDDRLTYTTWEGRTITNVDVLLRDPKVQETLRKGEKNRQQPSKKGYVAVVRYRKPE